MERSEHHSYEGRLCNLQLAERQLYALASAGSEGRE